MQTGVRKRYKTARGKDLHHEGRKRLEGRRAAGALYASGRQVDPERLAIRKKIVCTGAFDNCQSLVDAVAEKNAAERRRHHRCYTSQFQTGYSLRSRASAAEVSPGKNDVTLPQSIRKIRIDSFEGMPGPFGLVDHWYVSTRVDEIGVDVVSQFNDAAFKSC
jgi:hypothetical protein